MKKLFFLWVRLKMSERGVRKDSISQVIEQSPVNGGIYAGDSLPIHRWQWPADTFMRRRLSEIHANKTIH